MTRGFVLTVQPLLFGGYVHGPQVPRSLRSEGLPALGLVFMGGKRRKPSTPVGVAPMVQTEKKRLADCPVEPNAKIKRKPLGKTNKPNPRSLGTNPRSLGTNPRSLGTNPRSVKNR